jgi:hypothetical protein
VSAIFLKKINKGDIRATKQPLSANTKRFDLSVIANRYDMWIAYYVICDWIDDLTTKYWQLIDTLQKISDVPLVLNTSFNFVGKPIAETPRTRVTVLNQQTLM